VVYPTQQQTTSTVYSTTYNAVYSIPPIKDDAIKIVMGDDEKGITKEQKKQIIALIEKINTLRNRFNKLNAEVNALRAKINKYLNAANNNDKKFFDEDIRKDLKNLSDSIVKLAKDLANKKLNKNELNRIGQALEQAKAKLEKLRKAYQNQNQNNYNGIIQEIKKLLDEIQPKIKEALSQIDTLNEQIKLRTNQYNQAKNNNEYAKMVAALNDLINLYNLKVEKINDVKKLYEGITNKIDNIKQTTYQTDNITLPKLQIDEKNNDKNDDKGNNKQNQNNNSKGKNNKKK